MSENLITADEKVLHCLARLFQEQVIPVNADTKCLYCKYAFECAEEFKQNRKILFFDIIHELERKTSVKIFLNPGTIQSDILHGSWIKENSDLLEKFTSMSFDEQLDSLKNPDILKYRHNQDL